MIQLERERQGRSAVVTLARVPVNAVDPEWLSQFGLVLDELERDPTIAVVRIRSALKVFCAGFNLARIREHLEGGAGPAGQIADTRQMQDVYFRLERLPMVTIAEINGAAIGGGLELALCCDLRVAAADARIGLSEASLGQVPAAGGTQRLTRLCGPGVASWMILGCQLVTGEQAQALGVVQRAVEGSQLERETSAVAERISALPKQTLAAIKSCIAAQVDRGRAGFEMEMLLNHRLLGTPETQALVAAFFDRKKS